MATPTFIHPGPGFIQSNASANRYITSGELSAEAGLGTVTSLKSGSNITLQPSTLTVTGSIGVSPDLAISSATVTGNMLVSGNALFFSPIYQGSTAQRYLVSGEVSPTTVGSGITVLNELTTANQSFAVGSTGNDFAISSASQTHTFNIPDASTFARGLVTTGTQTISGAKTFIAPVTASGFIGQILQGGADSGGNLTLSSTSHATKGKILLGTSAYDEVNNRLGIGTTSPGYLLDIHGTGNPAIQINTSDGAGNVQYVSALGGNIKAWFGVAGATNALITGTNTGDFAVRANNQSILFSIDNGDTALMEMTNSRVGIGTTGPGAKLQVDTVASTTIGQIVKGAAAQSADLTQWRDSSGNIDVSVTAKRTINMASGVGDPAAPGAGYGSLRWEPGTNAGTLKIVAYAGSSTTGVTIVDNVGSGS